MAAEETEEKTAQEAESQPLSKAERKRQKAQEADDRARERARQAARKKSRKKKLSQSASANRRNVWLLVVTTLLVVVSVVMFWPPQSKINQGLDIQGGLSVVLTASTTDGSEITTDQMESSQAIIESRVDALGASEAVVQIQGDDQILVQIPGMSNVDEALEVIGKTGVLEFARLDSFTDEDVAYDIEYGYYTSEETVDDDYGNTFSTGGVEYLEVESGTYEALITGDNIESVTIDRESETSSYYAVNITLDSEGTEAFAEATADLVDDNGQIVIILDGEVQSAPAVQDEITSGEVSITGDYTLEEAQALKTVLESGSLPLNFEYEQSQVVGPTLGQEALMAGLMAAVVGLIIVMLYLLCFYRGLGIITAAAMAVFAVLYLGILAVLSAFDLFSLSMAGIAGIVLTIGMAADSSILTVERFREEIRMGRSVRAASITGVKHAIMTSIDADLVTLVSALSLFFLATASVKGFGLTLALGIMCDIVMMLLFKAPLIRLLAPRVIAKHPGFWGINDSLEAAAEVKGASADVPATTEASEAPAAEKKHHGRFIRRDINFLGHRRIFLTVSAVLVVCSLLVVGVKGLEFGIEFVGGTSVSFYSTGDITTEEMRDAFENAGEDDAVIQTTETDGEAGFLVRTTTTDAEEAANVATAVVEELGLTTDSFEVTTIGPDWGTSVIKSMVIAFVVSLILIIIYIAIRFEYKMGVIAIVALLHDLILVVGIYALVGREVNPNTVAALLTILGYSLYDTVVVFHRINDNMQGENIKCTFMSMANHSVNQVLLRTINTTLTSLIPVLAMLFFGGETLTDFAFAMAIGLVCGSYSSIAVAAPLYSMWKTREQRYGKLVKKYGPDVVRFEFGNPNALAEAEDPRRVARAAKEAARQQAAAEEAPAAEAEEAAEPAAVAAPAASAAQAKSSKGGSKSAKGKRVRRPNKKK